MNFIPDYFYVLIQCVNHNFCKILLLCELQKFNPAFARYVKNNFRAIFRYLLFQAAERPQSGQIRHAWLPGQCLTHISALAGAGDSGVPLAASICIKARLRKAAAMRWERLEIYRISLPRMDDPRSRLKPLSSKSHATLTVRLQQQAARA